MQESAGAQWEESAGAKWRVSLARTMSLLRTLSSRVIMPHWVGRRRESEKVAFEWPSPKLMGFLSKKFGEWFLYPQTGLVTGQALL